MNIWPDSRINQLFDIEYPIIQAPMAGSNDADLVIAVSKAGGLGSLPCALLSPEKIRDEIKRIRSQVDRPFNLNFFCHKQTAPDAAKESVWKDSLRTYYGELGLDPQVPSPMGTRHPFDDESCRIVEEFKPAVVSFHFGLPEERLVARVKAAGCQVMSSATTVEEAIWLEKHGCDAIIAQGFEAGGHRGIFLSRDIENQVGTIALVPQVVDAVQVPVIASGGIADARGILAAFALGAAAVQIGTAFLLATEARTSAIHRRSLQSTRDNQTVLTNLFTGRPARGIVNRLIQDQGALSDQVPEFPHAAGALMPLRLAAEAQGRGDFSPLWSGQAARLAKELPAADIIKALVADVQSRVGRGRGGDCDRTQ
ncbi:nitronate monooxygenase [Oligoflexus sp.]|uniref:NAD(P)H-dependent flavin oxidoreductase n=1 Tax=Oligoflexus sp. TaxID=1971216 RepID=UPI0032C20F07